MARAHHHGIAVQEDPTPSVRTTPCADRLSGGGGGGGGGGLGEAVGDVLEGLGEAVAPDLEVRQGAAPHGEILVGRPPARPTRRREGSLLLRPSWKPPKSWAASFRKCSNVQQTEPSHRKGYRKPAANAAEAFGTVM